MAFWHIIRQKERWNMRFRRFVEPGAQPAKSLTFDTRYIDLLDQREAFQLTKVKYIRCFSVVHTISRVLEIRAGAYSCSTWHFLERESRGTLSIRYNSKRQFLLQSQYSDWSVLQSKLHKFFDGKLFDGNVHCAVHIFSEHWQNYSFNNQFSVFHSVRVGLLSHVFSHACCVQEFSLAQTKHNSVSSILAFQKRHWLELTIWS